MFSLKKCTDPVLKYSAGAARWYSSVSYSRGRFQISGRCAIKNNAAKIAIASAKRFVSPSRFLAAPEKSPSIVRIRLKFHTHNPAIARRQNPDVISPAEPSAKTARLSTPRPSAELSTSLSSGESKAFVSRQTSFDAKMREPIPAAQKSTAAPQIARNKLSGNPVPKAAVNRSKNAAMKMAAPCHEQTIRTIFENSAARFSRTSTHNPPSAKNAIGSLNTNGVSSLHE